jgi:alpha-beta hydrolase superfamily lysophospholipase
MFISLILKALLGGLAAIGVIALALGALLANPVRPIPELASISDVRKSLDFDKIPAPDRFQARDGTELAYRHYPAIGPATNRIAILIHGSSGSSRGAGYLLAAALAAHGVETFAPDIRGHGASGTRGDIAYIGQLEDDLADLVALIRKDHPAAPLTLLGHSSGGGFALRVAASPIQTLFDRTVLIAPYLGYDAPSSRPNSGGWAQADVPRILALLVLNRVGISWANSLPVLTFAVPPNSKLALTDSYSFRLMRNFGTVDYRKDFAAATRPLTVFAAAEDELIKSDAFPALVGASVPVKMIDGVNHMGIISNPAAVSAIAEDVAGSAGAGRS